MLDKSDKSDKSSATPADKKEPVVVKKYANRRLYNTETSTYVTLDDLAAMVKTERDFVVSTMSKSPWIRGLLILPVARVPREFAFHEARLRGLDPKVIHPADVPTYRVLEVEERRVKSK